MDYSIPLNIPAKSLYKFIYVYENEYDKLLNPIFNSGNYCTYAQFTEIYKQMYPNISNIYAIKKCRSILKKLNELKFIEICSINKHKYFYLKKSGRALFTGNYLSVSKINKKADLKNDKFLISIMRIEYYITNNITINNSNLKLQLVRITEDISRVVSKYNLSYYNQNLIDKILISKNYDEIKSLVYELDCNNILRILWIDIYNIYLNLQKSNHTISINPSYLKMFIVDNKIKLHYAPNIYIYDLHDVSFYQKKLNGLFHNFFDITSNDTKDIRDNYINNNILGSNYKNHIGYSLTLIGYDKAALEYKVNMINKSIRLNPHNPLIKEVNYIYIDISKYINHSSHMNNAMINADSYVENTLNKLLNTI